MNILLLCLMNLLLSAETNLIIPKKLCKNCLLERLIFIEESKILL